MKVLNHGLELLELQDAVLVLLEQPNSSSTSSSSLIKFILGVHKHRIKHTDSGPPHSILAGILVGGIRTREHMMPPTREY